MFKQMMYKEWHLALQPPAVVFEFFGVMLLIPSYPYLVTFFYGLLGIFFICTFGRENHDVEYTALLPVSRSDIVKARITLCVLLELIQLGGAVICALLRPGLGLTSNVAGLDVNGAMFGFALLLIGLFNIIFFPMYYKNTDKIGIPFLIAAIVYGVGMMGLEILSHFPSMQILRGLAPQNLGIRVLVLVAGAVCFCTFTMVALRISIRRFQNMNLTQ